MKQNIENLINKTSIKDIDTKGLLKDFNTHELYHNKDIVFLNLAEAFIEFYEDAAKAGIAKIEASKTIMKVHEIALKRAIVREFKEKNDGSSEDLFKTASIEIKEAEEIKEKNEKKPLKEFIYSLRYAFDKWGEKKDLKVVEKVISNIEKDAKFKR